MDKETIIAIVGLLTAVAGLIRWLISVYWAQASTIEDLRNRNEKRNIITMKESIEDLKKEIQLHKNSMSTLQTKIEYIRTRLDKSADETQVMIKSVNDILDSMTQKMGLMESQVIALAKGMVMIKNKLPSGGAPNG